jgi:hypothetical protein
VLDSVSVLRPADIIVSTTAERISTLIRAGTGASVSHCMVYVGGSFIVEAVGSGVQKRPLGPALEGATLAIALRRRNLTDSQRRAVVEHADQLALKHLPYDSLGAAGAGLNAGRGGALGGLACGIWLTACGFAGGLIVSNALPRNADKAFFCSELGARVFELAGAPVVEGSPSFTAPRHIRTANTLLYVGKLRDTPDPS